MEKKNCSAAAVTAKPPCTAVHPPLLPALAPAPSAAALPTTAAVVVDVVVVVFAVCVWLPRPRLRLRGHNASTTTAGEADANSIIESTGTIKKLTKTFMREQWPHVQRHHA